MCGTDYALTKVYTFHLHSRWFFYQDNKKEQPKLLLESIIQYKIFLISVASNYC